MDEPLIVKEKKVVAKTNFYISTKANKELLDALSDVKQLDELQKKALIYRTKEILDEYTRRAYMYSCVYHFGRGIVTVGSLLVPALLSIQNSTTTSLAGYQADLYWITWSTSLMVTIFNGILTLFKVEKKYSYLNTLQERVRSEGWQYVQLTGKYGGHHFGPDISTHKNELIYFTHALERIKLQQTNDEYWKTQDNGNQGPNTTNEKKSLEGLYTPTPSTQQLQEIATVINFGKEDMPDNEKSEE